MTAILVLAVGLATVVGVTWLMVWFERAQHRRTERLRAAWRAGGSVGLEPGQWG